MKEQNIAELELQLKAEADKRDLTFAKNYNGCAYALMDVDWIGYFDTIDEVRDFLGKNELLFDKGGNMDKIHVLETDDKNSYLLLLKALKDQGRYYLGIQTDERNHKYTVRYAGEYIPVLF